ncbi:MAG: hypothetical protein WKG00_15195 [Polyangiaceae bacterium]
MRLGPLTQKAGARLVREALGDRLGPAEVAALVERSGGNAFHLEELVRAVFEGRGDSLPETVIAMAEGRLSRLDAEARRVLRAASVFGAGFQRAGVAALLGGRDAAELDAWLALARPRRSSARDARRRGPGRRRVGVPPRAPARGGLRRAHRRRPAPRASPRWRAPRPQRARGPAELAEHFERGESLERAAGWWRRAAELALGGNDLHAAATRAERAVRCGRAARCWPVRSSRPPRRGAGWAT